MTEVKLDVLAMPRERVAVQDFVFYVAHRLQIEDRALAERIADFVADEVEKAGADSAVLHFAEDGSGPWCSWCGALGGWCSHLVHKATE